MGKKLVDRRSRIKPFIKVVNYNHLMPTRYTLELEGLKGVVSQDTFKEVSQREDAKKTIKKALEDRYTSGKNRWFFTALRASNPIPTNILVRSFSLSNIFADFSFFLTRLLNGYYRAFVVLNAVQVKARGKKHRAHSVPSGDGNGKAYTIAGNRIRECIGELQF